MPQQESAIDWPMSRDEMKYKIRHLYNKDVEAADNIVHSGEHTLAALRNELDSVRQAAGISKLVPTIGASEDSVTSEAEVDRLRAAVENAAAVLRAILPTDMDEYDQVDATIDGPSTPPRYRARSEGGTRDKFGAPLRPALCRTPRGERTKPKRKVSFGSQPEEEPRRRAAMTDSEDEHEPESSGGAGATVSRHRDSLTLKSNPPIPDNNVGSSKPSLESAVDAKSKVRLHLVWGCCSLVLAFLAFRMGAPVAQPGMGVGDSACWVNGFSPEICCFGYGPGGNPGCWDVDHTYERCCLGSSDSSISN